MNAKTPANVTPIAKKSAAKQQPVEPTELTTDQAMEKPKPKSNLSWKERLALMTPEEAAAIRAKANAASKASKARAKGYDSPEVARAMRLQAQLSRNQEKTQTLAEERETIMAELQAIAEAAEQQAVETEVENEQA